jgi:hypothetical protein
MRSAQIARSVTVEEPGQRSDPPVTAGRRAFFLTFSITQRDAPPDAAAATSPVWWPWWARYPSMLQAIGAAVVTRSRQTRRAPMRLLMSFQTAWAGAGSGEVPGRALSSRLPVSVGERGSFMACDLAGCRGEAWLKKGLLSSK